MNWKSFSLGTITGATLAVTCFATAWHFSIKSQSPKSPATIIRENKFAGAMVENVHMTAQKGDLILKSSYWGGNPDRLGRSSAFIEFRNNTTFPMKNIRIAGKACPVTGYPEVSSTFDIIADDLVMPGATFEIAFEMSGLDGLKLYPPERCNYLPIGDAVSYDVVTRK